MEILQEKLCSTETKRTELQTQLDEIEVERDEEIKIIQDVRKFIVIQALQLFSLLLESLD